MYVLSVIYPRWFLTLIMDYTMNWDSFVLVFFSLLFSPSFFFISKHGLRLYHDRALIFLAGEDFTLKTQCTNPAQLETRHIWAWHVSHPCSLPPGRTQNQNLQSGCIISKYANWVFESCIPHWLNTDFFFSIPRLLLSSWYLVHVHTGRLWIGDITFNRCTVVCSRLLCFLVLFQLNLWDYFLFHLILPTSKLALLDKRHLLQFECYN